jgi:hypothetical protein
MGQGVVTFTWVGGSLSLTRDVGHMCSIRALEPEKDSWEIFCFKDDLCTI